MVVRPIWALSSQYSTATYKSDFIRIYGVYSDKECLLTKHNTVSADIYRECNSAVEQIFDLFIDLAVETKIEA